MCVWCALLRSSFPTNPTIPQRAPLALPLWSSAFNSKPQSERASGHVDSAHRRAKG